MALFLQYPKDYQLLFVHLLQNQINVADNIPRYLQAELKLLTTQCMVIETENLGPKVSGALHILKQYSIHKCGHEGKPVSGAKCMLSMLGKKNEKHYVVATQDYDLQSKLRLVPGVPLLYLHQKAPVLERPSEITVRAASNKLNELTELEKQKVEELKKQSGLLQELSKPKKRKKKGPNPLSCKKKKKVVSDSNKAVKSDILKPKRKKVRIPKHVKEELFKAVAEK